MIEVEQAIEKLGEVISPQKEIEIVDILDSVGRICAEEVYAQMNVPNFPRSGMDGYAVRANETIGASIDKPIYLRVIGTAFAGQSTDKMIGEANTAMKIMTGGHIPKGYDAVIKQEWTDGSSDCVAIYRQIDVGKNYGAIGEDVVVNQKLIRAFQKINSRIVGVLAAQGIQRIAVLKPMKVGILTTGDELMALNCSLETGQLYNSNLYVVASFIKESGSQLIFKEHCEDQVDKIAEKIEQKIESVDLLITTGGVSVGEKDFLPSSVQKIGAEELFHYVNMKPGTPVMASHLCGRIILSLSGNPFASLVNLHLFYWEILVRFMNCSEIGLKKRQVILNAGLKASKIRRFVRAYEKDGKVYLFSKKHLSSMFFNTIETNCFIDQKENSVFKKGDKVTIYYWKD